MKNTNDNYISSILHQWMTQAQINNYGELSSLAGVSLLQFYRLKNGLLDSTPLGILKKIADGLNISVHTLIDDLSENKNLSSSDIEQIESNLKWEYQQEAISILESLILQLPTFTHAVENNSNLPASKLIPLLEPLKELLSQWDIETIGNVGEIVSYNPQEHELMDNNNNLDKIETQSVKIRYVGYRHQDKLLYRAKVCSVLEP